VREREKWSSLNTKKGEDKRGKRYIPGEPSIDVYFDSSNASEKRNGGGGGLVVEKNKPGPHTWAVQHYSGNGGAKGIRRK